MSDDTAKSASQKTSLPILSQVQIKSPCLMNWDEMDGDASRRFCGQCQKHVHNFEEMDAHSVSTLLGSGQNICAKIQRRLDGSIVTKECRVTRRGWFAKLGALAASLVAMLTLGGCRESIVNDVTNNASPPSSVEAPMLMGEVEAEIGDVMIEPELVPETPNESVQMLGKVIMPESK